MPLDVNNLKEVEKFLRGKNNTKVRNKNLLVKFMVPKTNEKFELDCGRDDLKFSERFHASLQELLEHLNTDEELVLDVELRLGFKTEWTYKQQRAQLDKAEEAAKEFYPGPAANWFYRSIVCGPFNVNPEAQNPNREVLYETTSPDEKWSAGAEDVNQKSADEISVKMDRTQDDSSYQKRKKKRLYFTKDVERIARISLEVADEIESPVRTAESLNSPRKNKKSKTSPKIVPLGHK